MANVDINAAFAAQAAENNASKKDMIYFDDQDTPYVVQITENIGEALGFADYTGADVGNVDDIPKGFVMRKIRFADATGNISGEYPVGSRTAPIYVEGGTITVPRRGKAAGLLCAVTGAIGERRRFPKSFDTGQDSGDET